MSEPRSFLARRTAALTQMAAMGFFDQEKNIALLKKHKGSMNEAVADLLGFGKEETVSLNLCAGGSREGEGPF